MQLITILPAVAVMTATANAFVQKTAAQLNNDCDTAKPYAEVVNRCDYPVNLWSILRSIGCSDDGMVTLKPGETYRENFQDPQNGAGVSIKISKTKQCKGNDITQLEYYLQQGGQYASNYLDVSYVDCLDGDCPTMKEGFYLQSGDQKSQVSTKNAGNTVCPVLSCTDRASCSKIAYVLPDDIQTRSCGLDQNLHFYMCGGNPPSANDNKPVSSPKVVDPPAKPSTKASENYKVNAAAVTPAPEVKEPSKAPKIKTNIVYVTKYEYVNAKRHAHAHARRHQNFHA